MIHICFCVCVSEWQLIFDSELQAAIEKADAAEGTAEGSDSDKDYSPPSKVATPRRTSSASVEGKKKGDRSSSTPSPAPLERSVSAKRKEKKSKKKKSSKKRKRMDSDSDEEDMEDEEEEGLVNYGVFSFADFYDDR
jgi:hypothetical protein